jgi:hypothetical protein
MTGHFNLSEAFQSAMFRGRRATGAVVGRRSQTAACGNWAPPRDLKRAGPLVAAQLAEQLKRPVNAIDVSLFCFTFSAAMVTAFLIAFGVRGLAIKFGWTLPVFRESTKLERWKTDRKDANRGWRA